MPGGKFPGAAEPNSHAHEFDEVVTFIGNNVEDPYDLGGEIEFWLEDEDTDEKLHDFHTERHVSRAFDYQEGRQADIPHCHGDRRNLPPGY